MAPALRHSSRKAVGVEIKKTATHFNIEVRSCLVLKAASLLFLKTLKVQTIFGQCLNLGYEACEVLSVGVLGEQLITLPCLTEHINVRTCGTMVWYG